MDERVKMEKGWMDRWRQWLDGCLPTTTAPPKLVVIVVVVVVVVIGVARPSSPA